MVIRSLTQRLVPIGAVLAVAVVFAACSSSSATAVTSPAASEPAASVPTASEPAASVPAASEPAASVPPASAPAAGGGSTAVEIKGFAFNPAEITVAKGGTVTWTNNDGATHTVTFDTGGVDSGRLAGGATFEHAFDSAGSFAYHCAIHPSMKGTVTVTP